MLLKLESSFNVDKLLDCIAEINANHYLFIYFFFLHFLNFNDKKTEVMLFWPSDPVSVHPDFFFFFK